MITMIPGGAMMFCESIAEFDRNVRWPSNVQNLPINESAAGIQEKFDDPVEKYIEKLGKLYREDIKPYLNYTYDYADNEEALYKLNNLQNTFTLIVNTIRKAIFKLHGYIILLSDPNTKKSCNFYSHMGFYMNNAPRVIERGLSEFSYQVRLNRALSDSYSTYRLIDVFINSPEMADQPIYKETIGAIVGEEFYISQRYNGLVDLLECLYNDQDRRIRLESREMRSLRFQDLMTNGYHGYESAADDHKAVTDINVAFSKLLRQTCRQVYTLLCMIPDQTLTPEIFAKEYRAMCYRVVNTFAFGSILVMCQAYDLREKLANFQARDDYDVMLQNELNPKATD